MPLSLNTASRHRTVISTRIRNIVTGLPDVFRRWFTRFIVATGYELVNIQKLYEFDGLHTIHNPRFKKSKRFHQARERGSQASLGDSRGDWRVHVGLWAAAAAARVEGDFVECGVNAGFLSSAILRYLDWENLGKTFYLVDTFSGPVLEQFSAEEIARGLQQKVKEAIGAENYVTDMERIRRNYQEWKRVEIVQGVVPDVLPWVLAHAIAFLHLDMNCAFPETEALRFFWHRISTGGIILLDDYSYFGFDAQGDQMDRVAAELGVEILALPTGQGMLIK